MSTLTRAAAYTARIAAVTAAAPVLAGAAASAATAKLAELQQLASSPLSAEAMRLRTANTMTGGNTGRGVVVGQVCEEGSAAAVDRPGRVMGAD